ncbi:hypothetical protein [Streptomyces zaomyceticus]|uniref:hypothetical protein n=1 Tax=Streptomyces zaomyceticus TaxID=68286 RepID=UPI0038B53BB9
MSRPSAPPVTRTAAFTLWGEVAEPARLTVADLRTGWEQHRIEVVFDCATAGPQPAPGTSAP